MYKLITLTLGIYIIYYVWRAYTNMKKLKQNMSDAPRELLISYDNQINNLWQQLVATNEIIAKNQGFLPNFSVNRVLKKAKKHQSKLKEQIEQKEATRSNYLKLLEVIKIEKLIRQRWKMDKWKAKEVNQNKKVRQVNFKCNVCGKCRYYSSNCS